MDINKLVQNYFKDPGDISQLNDFFKLVEETLQPNEAAPPLVEKKTKGSGGRFSFDIPIPTFTPSEAWGDPDSQDRREVDRLFRAITGGQDIKARIASINTFLNPASAKRKTSPSVIINMMMIVEALQATLNDYNESASGFVFEGFMAALTGGKQIAGKVAGTLPIEDFVAFSAFGGNVPVSLKLLSPKTGVKGSFTNIVDFLLVRGKPAIKYLVAYKLTKGGKVQKLELFAFDITRENFIDFIVGSRGQDLLAPLGAAKLKAAMAAFAADPKAALPEVAAMITQLDGYNRQGLLHKFVATGELPTDKTPEEEAEEEERRWIQKQKGYKDLKVRHQKALQQQLEESIAAGEINATLTEAFHYIEKQTLFQEGSDTKSQWEASHPQLVGMGGAINLESYGELDLSQENIDELSEIYTEKLKGGIMTLLEKAKDLTENVGAYYSEKKRSQAQAAANKAQGDAAEIQDVLAEDPRYQKK